MAKQSKSLTAFYKAYYTWLIRGAPDYSPFRRSVGLCTNLIFSYAKGSRNWRRKLAKEMATQFEEAGLDREYPWGKAAYWKSKGASTMHLGRKRRKWVHDHAELIPKQSKELTEFYREWWENATSEYPSWPVTEFGLCWNAAKRDLQEDIVHEMRAQFIAAGLSPEYPFGEAAYDSASENDTLHEDPNRLAWVEAHLDP